MRNLVVLLASLALVLALAGPAAAAKEYKYKDKDGGTIIVSGEIQYLDKQGKPTGPKKDMPAPVVTIDGEPATPVSPTTPVESLVAARAATPPKSGCATGYATITKNSVLGTRLLQFWHYVNWCWNYPAITGTPSRWTDGKGSNGWAYDGVVSASAPTFFQWCCLSPRSGHRRQFRGGFHFPVWVAQATYYPWIRAEPHGNGTSYYAAGF